MSDEYSLNRLCRMASAVAHLSNAHAALKKAHGVIPELCGSEREQIHGLMKLTDARRMSIFDRMSKGMKALEES